MNFRSLTRTYNRFSLPKKVATGGVAIAGIGALIGIPVLTLNPMRPPTVINEDAYYKTQVTDPSLGGENTASSPIAPNLDTTTPADIPIYSNNSAQTAIDSSNSTQHSIDSSNSAQTPIGSSKSAIPGSNSNLGSNSFGIDTSDIPSNIGENSPRLSRIGRGGSSQNPYSNSSSKPMSNRYTPNGSLSSNPYNASSRLPKNYSSPGDTSLRTRYSLPIPTSSNTYNLQPSPGNVYSNPNSQASTGAGKNSLLQSGSTPNTSISGNSPFAPSTVNSQSGGFNQPTSTTGTGEVVNGRINGG